MDYYQLEAVSSAVMAFATDLVAASSTGFSLSVCECEPQVGGVNCLLIPPIAVDGLALVVQYVDLICSLADFDCCAFPASHVKNQEVLLIN